MENVQQEQKREQALLKAEYLSQESARRIADWFHRANHLLTQSQLDRAKVKIFPPVRVKVAA